MPTPEQSRAWHRRQTQLRAQACALGLTPPPAADPPAERPTAYLYRGVTIYVVRGRDAAGQRVYTTSWAGDRRADPPPFGSPIAALDDAERTVDQQLAN